MSPEQAEIRKQLFISVGALATAFFVGIPWIDLANTHNVIEALSGRTVTCGQDVSMGNPEALILLSAGNDKVKQAEPNYHEKRRMDALVYEYLQLLENGTPPRVIILALDDGIVKNYRVRNYIQKAVAKHMPGTEISNELFITVHAGHTDTSLREIRQTLDSQDIIGSVAIVTSEPHVNRARYNTCRRGINGYTLSADQLVSANDPDTFQQMQRLKRLPSYERAWIIEKAKILSWMWRPNNIGTK